MWFSLKGHLTSWKDFPFQPFSEELHWNPLDLYLQNVEQNHTSVFKLTGTCTENLILLASYMQTVYLVTVKPTNTAEARSSHLRGISRKSRREKKKKKVKKGKKIKTFIMPKIWQYCMKMSLGPLRVAPKDTWYDLIQIQITRFHWQSAIQIRKEGHRNSLWP